jgi:type IV secretory pathway TrbD component
MNQLPPGVPDSHALRRRVLLTGLVAIVLWLVATYCIYLLGVSDAWVLVALFLIYLLAIRPLMRPVRDAMTLRHRLAYESYLDEKRSRGES